jgi:ArsR family transcriptional regulator
MKAKDPFPRLSHKCEDAARVLKALAHGQRLRLLCKLASGEKTVGELEKASGASQSAVSQFLARMKAEGLVSSYKDGQFVRYRIADPKIVKLIRSLHAIFCPA